MKPPSNQWKPRAKPSFQKTQHPKPLHHTKQIELTIDQVESSGEFSVTHNERKFFVRDTIPGEEITAQITALSQQRKEGFANLLFIRKPSPERVPVMCEHVGVCGGCDWQHINQTAQLRYKQELVQRSMMNIAVEQCRPSPESYQYRYVAKWVSRMQLGKVWLGAFARRSHDITSTQGCAVHREPLEEVGDILRDILNQPLGTSIALHLRYVVARQSFISNEIAVVLIFWRRPLGLEAFVEGLRQPKIKSLLLHINQQPGDSLFDHSAPTELLFGDEGVTEEIAGCRVPVPMQAFLQINPAQAKQMQQEALTLAAPESQAKIIELYAGVSSLSLSLAKQLPEAKISSIERSTQAVQVAERVKGSLSLTNISLYQGDAVEIFKKEERCDVLFLNPPRAGASPAVIQAIVDAAPQKIVYTSCSPKTFARDAALLVAGGFMVKRVVPFDLFPQTAHVEIVALFERPHPPLL